MADVEHKDITPEHQHPIVRWTWANSAARLAQAVTADDVHKVGYQTSDATYWFLSDDSPVTWNSLTGTWAQVLANGATSGAYNPTIDSGQYLQFAGEVTIKRNGADVITTDADETRIFGHAAGSSVTYWIEATKFATMGVLGGGYGYLSFAEAYDGIITMDPRATNNAGRNLRLIGGNAGPVGDLDGGSVFLQPGARNGAGAYGAVNIGSEDSVVRIAMNSDRDVVLNGLATVNFQVAGDTLAMVDRIAGEGEAPGLLLMDGASGTDSAFFLRAVTPDADRAGLDLFIQAGNGGTPSANNGGDILMVPGAENGGGTDGTFSVSDAALNTRFKMLANGDLLLSVPTLTQFKVDNVEIAGVDEGSLYCIGIRGSSEGENMFVHAPPSDWNDAEKVVFIGDCDVAPTAGESGGGILYSEAGALKWIGPSGTITPMGAA